MNKLSSQTTISGAANDGRTIPLSETTKFIVDNRGKTAPTADTGIALIATNCITNDHLYPQYVNVRRVSQETYNTWFRAHPEPGDIILTNKGSKNGAICLVPDPVDFVIAQDMMALRANEEVIDPLFLFAALRSPMAQWQIKNLDVSGVIPHFKKTDFDKLHLPYPDRETQEAIGRIYFDFCAKIELNRQMNETLEATARALFESWFVDFDPVRAKMDGQKPLGMDEQTAKLFPASLDHSAFGIVPRGWDVLRINERAEINYGKNLPKREWLSNGIPVYGAAGVVGYYSKAMFSEPVVLVTSRGSGSGAVHETHGPAFVTNNSFTVIPKESWFSRHYLRFCLLEADILSLVTGSAQPQLTVNNFEFLELLCPDRRILEVFHSSVDPMWEMANDNRKQSWTLASLRDTLLPKLLSGEVGIG